MGMFDYVRCSKDIGELTDVECQTKDIDPWMGGTMTFYWIDPAGAIWYADYTGTSDFVESNEPDLRPWERIKAVSNGNHGKFLRHNITDYVTIYRYDSSPDGLSESVECRLHFIDGILQDYNYINKYTLS